MAFCVDIIFCLFVSLLHLCCLISWYLASIIVCMSLLQVQDYYVALKFNNGSKCVRSLYRLTTACCMLHQCRNAGATRGHPYPKIMILFLLVLQHWRTSKYCGYEMMRSNMSMFNEELGELTFSILARSVLADHTRDDFVHMDRLFRLLRVYRDVKSDVVADNSGASNSLNWRHKIKKDGEEVMATELFFKKIIRQMVSGTYQSYDGSPKSYTSAQNGSELRELPKSPLVFMTKKALDDYLQVQLVAIRNDMKTNFLYPYSHIWPECINHDDEHDGDEQVVQRQGGNEVQEEDVELDDGEEVEQAKDVSDEEGVVVDDNKVEEQEVDDEVENVPDPDHVVDATNQRGWEAWGTINSQNTVVGKRQRKEPERFEYKGRRRGGHYPNPSGI